MKISAFCPENSKIRVQVMIKKYLSGCKIKQHFSKQLKKLYNARKDSREAIARSK